MRAHVQIDKPESASELSSPRCDMSAGDDAPQPTDDAAAEDATPSGSPRAADEPEAGGDDDAALLAAVSDALGHKERGNAARARADDDAATRVRSFRGRRSSEKNRCAWRCRDRVMMSAGAAPPPRLPGRRQPTRRTGAASRRRGERGRRGDAADGELCGSRRRGCGRSADAAPPRLPGRRQPTRRHGRDRSRGDAATRALDGSRDMTTQAPYHGHSAVTSRGAAAAATRTFRGDESTARARRRSSPATTTRRSRRTRTASWP